MNYFCRPQTFLKCWSSVDKHFLFLYWRYLLNSLFSCKYVTFKTNLKIFSIYRAIRVLRIMEVDMYIYLNQVVLRIVVFWTQCCSILDISATTLTSTNTFIRSKSNNSQNLNLLHFINGNKRARARMKLNWPADYRRTKTRSWSWT